MTCAFFGHRDVLNDIEVDLFEVMLDLIENQGVNSFYVGYQGSFDRIVLNVLKQVKSKYCHISYAVVLAYLSDAFDDCETVYPEGLEKVPPKFAISARNRWMVENSQYVVTYVTRTFGGAAQFKELAIKKGKTVIEIAK